MLDAGDGACAMEVSSHALELHRVDGDPLRRRGVHQPEPGPPRLPPRHGELLPRPRCGCSRSSTWARRSSSSTTRGARGWPSELPGAVTVSLDGPADWQAVDIRAGHRRHARSRSARPRGDAEVELPLRGRFNAANALVAMACGARAGRGARRDGRGARRRRGGPGARPGRRRGAGVRACSWTTRTSRARWRRSCCSARELTRRPRDRRLRRRRRPRPRQAAGDGGDRRAARRRRRRHVRQPALGGCRRRSSTRSSPACPPGPRHVERMPTGAPRSRRAVALAAARRRRRDRRQGARAGAGVRGRAQGAVRRRRGRARGAGGGR